MLNYFEVILVLDDTVAKLVFAGADEFSNNT
jgi:hypothetical protein